MDLHQAHKWWTTDYYRPSTPQIMDLCQSRDKLWASIYHMTKYGLSAKDKTNCGFPANHKTNCGLPTNHKTNYGHLPITQQIMNFPQTARHIMDLHQLPTQSMGLNQAYHWLQTSHQSRQELCSCHLTTHNYESMAHPPPTRLIAKLWPIHLLPNYDQSTS